MTLKSLLGISCAALLLTFNACETDDVEPTYSLTLTSSNPIISEASGTTNIVATLSNAADQALTVNLIFQGTATETVDYTASSKTITIPAGSLSGSISITAIQDSLQEGNESIDISVLNTQGVELENTGSTSIIIEDDDVAAVAQFIINEVLYDPSNNALDGDANGDGVYGQDDDSFIELYNPSSQPFDLVGYEIWDDTTSGSIQYTFPANSVIPPLGALVVFGGGNPTGNFGGAIVLNASSGLNFNNSGEVIGLKDPNGAWTLIFDSDALSNNPNESYTRNPDITGDFEQHNDNTPLLFSPGTKVDGSSF
ncbi:MAG: lamin tail domain-containing protein [Vicingaceae bacterium]